MKGWIEVTNVGSGRKALINVGNILWITPAQYSGRDFTLISMANGSIIADENYDYVKDDIEEAIK